MVTTIKFSEFIDEGDLEPNQTTVGLASGGNARFNNPFPLLPPGTTGDRPAPDPTMYFRLRYNTTTSHYEFYDSVSATWMTIPDSSVGSFAPDNATFLLQVANPDLANAQAMGSLASGIVVNTTLTGVQLTRLLAGTANQLDVTNADGILGNPTFTLSATLIAPGTVQVGNLLLDTNTLSSVDLNGDLNLTPDGTGNLVLDGLNWPQADGPAGYKLTTNGSGQLSWTPDATGGMTIVEVTTASQAMLPNTGYIANSSSTISFTMPATSPVGSQMAVYGYGSGGWIINNYPSGSQQIIYGVVETSIGGMGNIQSTNRYDQIILTCVVADTIWVASSPMGSLNAS